MIQKSSKLHIGVLMGGRSGEREVSLNSGRTVCDHLDASKYTIVPLFQHTDGKIYLLPWHFLHRGKTTDFAHRLEAEAVRIRWDDLKKHVDFMFIAQHGQYAEDGRLQGALEILQIPYYGSKVLASALGMHKAMQKIFLSVAGITVPQGITYKAHQQETCQVERFPVVIKPAQEGSSLGVSVAYNQHELLDALEKVRALSKSQDIIIEEFIKGMEFSCIVLYNHAQQKWHALSPSEIVLEKNARFFDYEQKYMPGRATKHTPARVSPDKLSLIQETCIRVAQVLGFTTIGRIDGFLTADGNVVITDPNSFAGLDPASFVFLQAAEHNMSHTQFINYLIENDLMQYDMSSHTSDNLEEQASPQMRTRVGVLLGGRSNEREISLASGRNIVYKLSPEKYETLPLFVSSQLELFHLEQRQLVRNTTAEIEASVKPEQQVLWDDLKRYVDFVFIGLHGGEGENGCVQGMLETLGIAYNGSSVLASGLCMDKFATNNFLKRHGIAVPDGILLDRISWLKGMRPSISTYPCIVKPHNDGCSVGVKKIDNATQLEEAVEKIFSLGKDYALLEELIQGVELTVGVIGNAHAYALPPSMAVATAGILSIEEKFLPGAGENQTPAPLPEDVLALVKQTAEAAYTAVGCAGYARIDCFYQPAHLNPSSADRIVILEINTLPGMTPATCIFHQAAELGLRPMEFIDVIIQLGFEKHAPERMLSAHNILAPLKERSII